LRGDSCEQDPGQANLDPTSNEEAGCQACGQSGHQTCEKSAGQTVCEIKLQARRQTEVQTSCQACGQTDRKSCTRESRRKGHHETGSQTGCQTGGEAGGQDIASKICSRQTGAEEDFDAS